MKTRGVRILDTIDHIVTVELQDILEEISKGEELHWSIQFLDAVGHLGGGKSIVALGKQIRESEHGYVLTWNDLNELAKKFDQIIDILILGCGDKNLLIRYEDDEEMYENCDIVIEMIDTSFWQVFSKNISLIDRLTAKFKEVELLESDFHNQ